MMVNHNFHIPFRSLLEELHDAYQIQLENIQRRLDNLLKITWREDEDFRMQTNLGNIVSDYFYSISSNWERTSRGYIFYSTFFL